MKSSRWTWVAAVTIPLATGSARADDVCISTSAPITKGTSAELFARAEADFAAKRWEEAASTARWLAMRGTDATADPELGARAAKLYLESVGEIGIRKSRPACFEAAARDVPRLEEAYCATDDAHEKHPDTCNVLTAIRFDMAHLEAQQALEAADKARLGGADATERYREAGTKYYEVFRMFCADRAFHGKPPASEHCDIVGYSGARAFGQAHSPAKAIAMYRSLLAFDENAIRIRGARSTAPVPRDKRSPFVAKAMFEIAGAYQSIAGYEHAADWYERFAKDFPNDEDAAHALSNATSFRLGLGQIEQATADVDRFVKSFSSTLPAQTAQVVLALATHHADRKELERARCVLVPTMQLFRVGPIDIQIRGHALAARAGLRTPEEYERVRSLYQQTSGRLAREVRTTWPSDDDRTHARRLGKALVAVGDAYFDAAERRRGALEALAFPVPTGPAAADARALTDHMTRVVKPWLEKRSEAISAVEAEYAKLLDLESPPPAATVRSAARVAIMWTDLLDAFDRGVVRPKTPDPAFNAALLELRRPLETVRAKPALLKCRDLATKLQQVEMDDPLGPQACEAWLAQHDPREIRRTNEIMPTLSTTRDLPPPLRFDGTPYRGAEAL